VHREATGAHNNNARGEARPEKKRQVRAVGRVANASGVRSKACIEVWIKGKMVGQVLIFN
jgi:hypothetical protein